MKENVGAKIVEIDLTQIECCNTCLNGKRRYDSDGDFPIGVECLKNQSNECRFDYICGFLYEPDVEFMESNKDLSKIIRTQRD